MESAQFIVCPKGRKWLNRKVRMGRQRLVNVQAEKFALGSEDNAGAWRLPNGVRGQVVLLQDVPQGGWPGRNLEVQDHPPHPPCKKTCEEATGAPGLVYWTLCKGTEAVQQESRRCVLCIDECTRLAGFQVLCGECPQRNEAWYLQQPDGSANKRQGEKGSRAGRGALGYQMILREGCGFQLCDCQKKP